MRSKNKVKPVKGKNKAATRKEKKNLTKGASKGKNKQNSTNKKNPKSTGRKNNQNSRKNTQTRRAHSKAISKQKLKQLKRSNMGKPCKNCGKMKAGSSQKYSLCK